MQNKITIYTVRFISHLGYLKEAEFFTRKEADNFTAKLDKSCCEHTISHRFRPSNYQIIPMKIVNTSQIWNEIENQVCKQVKDQTK